jgi:predicted Zn-dependent peptidase
VLALRRRGVPLAELRLRIPFAGPTGKGGRAHTAQAQLLGDTLLSGTERRTAAAARRRGQAVGGQLNATTTPTGSASAARCSSAAARPARRPRDVLTGATFPKHEVVGERDRLVQELAIVPQPGLRRRP